MYLDIMLLVINHLMCSDTGDLHPQSPLGEQTQGSWNPGQRQLLEKVGKVAVCTVTLGSVRSEETFQVENTVCKAGSEEAQGWLERGSSGGVVLWERGEEATVVDWGQEEPRHLASVFLSVQLG